MSGIDIFDDQPGEDRPMGAVGPSPPDLPGPSPSPTESRADKLVASEQQRSERQRIDAIQRQLRLETSSRSRGYGLRSLIGALGQGRSSLLGAG
jgi:hypothetical protein